MDEKYGVIIEEHTVELNESRPIRIAVIDHRDTWWVDIRRMYKRGNGTLSFGKGVRLCIDDGEAEEIMLAVETLLGAIEFEGDE